MQRKLRPERQPPAALPCPARRACRCASCAPPLWAAPACGTPSPATSATRGVRGCMLVPVELRRPVDLLLVLGRAPATAVGAFAAPHPRGPAQLPPHTCQPTVAAACCRLNRLRPGHRFRHVRLHAVEARARDRPDARRRALCLACTHCRLLNGSQGQGRGLGWGGTARGSAAGGAEAGSRPFPPSACLLHIASFHHCIPLGFSPCRLCRQWHHPGGRGRGARGGREAHGLRRL